MYFPPAGAICGCCEHWLLVKTPANGLSSTVLLAGPGLHSGKNASARLSRLIMRIGKRSLWLVYNTALSPLRAAAILECTLMRACRSLTYLLQVDRDKG